MATQKSSKLEIAVTSAFFGLTGLTGVSAGAYCMYNAITNPNYGGDTPTPFVFMSGAGVTICGLMLLSFFSPYKEKGYGSL